jgi:hypothetical protein
MVISQGLLKGGITNDPSLIENEATGAELPQKTIDMAGQQQGTGGRDELLHASLSPFKETGISGPETLIES